MSVSTPFIQFSDGPGASVDRYQESYQFFKVLPGSDVSHKNPFKRGHIVDSTEDVNKFAFPRGYNTIPEQSYYTRCCDTKSTTYVSGRRIGYDPTEEATHLRSDLTLRGNLKSKTTRVMFGIETENADFQAQR